MKFLVALVPLLALVVVGVSGQSTNTGICSWYGAEGEIPQGWPTACGNGFDRFALASAHPNVPQFKCGTKIRVKNLDNGKTVDVVVDDKGPAPGTGRILDLTWAAFGAIENRDKAIRVSLGALIL